MAEEAIFSADATAIRFVRRAARCGDTTAAKAIQTHDKNIARWRRWRKAHGY